MFSWNCEFCGHFNELNLEEGEIPTKFQSEYMLVPPSNEVKKQLTIFCIDISGSMYVVLLIWLFNLMHGSQ